MCAFLLFIVVHKDSKVPVLCKWQENLSYSLDLLNHLFIYYWLAFPKWLRGRKRSCIIYVKTNYCMLERWMTSKTQCLQNVNKSCSFFRKLHTNQLLIRMTWPEVLVFRLCLYEIFVVYVQGDMSIPWRRKRKSLGQCRAGAGAG